MSLMESRALKDVAAILGRSRASVYEKYKKAKAGMAATAREQHAPWTRGEISNLLLLMKSHTLDQVAKILGRPRGTVYYRYIRALAGDRSTARAPYRPWSERDREILRRMWPNHCLRDVAAALGRESASVEIYAKRHLGLVKSAAHLLSIPHARHHAYPPELREAIKLAGKIEEALHDK